MSAGGHRLAVLGSPIEHSLSPRLHAAAYGVLGLDWEYGRHEVGRSELARFVDGLDATWRGLSLTMPLKDEAVALADRVDAAAALTGAVNTLSLGGQVTGFNTDVPGIIDAFAERGVAAGDHAVVLGAGATARSVLVALQRMGVRSVDIRARRAGAAAGLGDLAAAIGLHAASDGIGSAIAHPSLVVSTLPGGASPELPALRLGEGSELFDVAYSDPRSAVRSWWAAAGGAPSRVDGLDMLVGQALRQIRIFVGDDIDLPLTDEPAVLRAMRAAVGRS